MKNINMTENYYIYHTIPQQAYNIYNSLLVFRNLTSLNKQLLLIN